MAKKFYKKNWIISQLRRLSMKYPPRLKVLNAAKTTYYIDSKIGTKVKRVSFECAQCHTKDLKSKEIAVDHIIPVVSLEGWTNWEDFVNGLFCEEENLQVICENCHSIKSAGEQKQRFFKKRNK